LAESVNAKRKAVTKWADEKLDFTANYLLDAFIGAHVRGEEGIPSCSSTVF
jgi:hypothetical protein